MPGVDKINRTGTGSVFQTVHYSYMYNTLCRGGPLDRLREKSLFRVKPSLTASRYISQDDDDAISEHSRVTGRFRTRKDIGSVVKRDVNCRERRKMLEKASFSRVMATGADVVVLSKKQKSKWESKQVFKESLLAENLPASFTRAVIMPHYYSIKKQRRSHSTKMIEELRKS